MLDQFIAWIAPETALRRARARAALSALGARAYEGASRADRMSDWRTTSNSAAAEVAPALELLRARARDLRRNNPWAARGVALIASNLVVYGIAASIEANGKGAQKRAERLMPALKAWAESTACDADGMSNLAGLQSLVAASVAGDGEILIRRRMRRLSDGLPVPMQLQLLEGDYLQNTTQALASGRIVQGVEFDGIGRRAAYHLYRDHPGDWLGLRQASETVRVPADDIAHVFRVDRQGQVRGVTWLAPLIITLRTLDEYEDAQLMRQKVAACFAGSLRTPDAEVEDAERQKWEGRTVEPGTISVLPLGTELDFTTPPAAEGYAPYTATQLRRVAAGLGVPYEALTGDLSQVNFSSARMGWQEFGRNIESWRWQMLMPQGLDRIGAWFLEAAAAAGYDTAGLSVQWTPPSRTLVDPARETQPIIDQIRAGLISPQEAIRERGYDPDQVLADWRAFADQLDALGLTLDIDPRVEARQKAAAQNLQEASVP